MVGVVGWGWRLRWHGWRRKVVELELELLLLELLLALEQVESGWRLVPGVTTRRYYQAPGRVRAKSE